MKPLVHNTMFNYKQDESLTIKYLQLEVTNVCNADCFFCSRRFKNQKPKHLTLNELKNITKNFDHIKFIKLQGLGEPMFCPELPEMIAHLKEKYPDIVIMSATNLTVPKKDEQLKLILKQLDILYLSIDGDNKRTFELIRKGLKWETMLKTVEQLKKCKQPANNFVISLTVSDLNFREIEGIVNIAREHAIDEVRINPVQDWTSDNKLTTEANYSMDEYIAELRKWHQSNSENPSVIVVGDPQFNYTKCVWPFERMYIDVYGDVYLCVVSLDDKWIQGNIFKQSFEDIYKNKMMNEIREGLKTNKPHEHCVNCSYKCLAPSLQKIKN